MIFSTTSSIQLKLLCPSMLRITVWPNFLLISKHEHTWFPIILLSKIRFRQKRKSIGSNGVFTRWFPFLKKKLPPISHYYSHSWASSRLLWMDSFSLFGWWVQLFGMFNGFWDLPFREKSYLLWKIGPKKISTSLTLKPVAVLVPLLIPT